MTFEPSCNLDETRSGRPAPRRGALPMLLGIALLMAGPGAMALSSDREKNIEIEADSAERDDANGITVYRGDVIIVQGTLRITGAKVTIHSDENGDFEKMVTLGKPARFRQLPDGEEDRDENYQTATASRMEYFKEKDLIVLLGNAVYGQGGDRVAADRIEYDSKRSRMVAKTVKATKTPTSKDPARTKRNRVRITIKPKQSN